LDSARWQLLERVFLESLDKSPSDLPPFLDEATQGDKELRAEIEEMLAAHSGGEGLAIESMLSDGGADRAQPTTRAGPFRLVERIGRGGMGEVWRAERADGQFEQTVAVKLIRSGIATPEMMRRFRAERQILARLEHPHIARLLDGGVTDLGLPWLAMEHVSGRTITEHCETAKLPLEGRLTLFASVCRAVQVAHQNLIVHRDLKPSNILVTDAGEPKLLDFGVAKLLEAEGVGPAATARTALELMTPEYASPEQVRGGAITTATDVYALGLLLYELLTGRRAQRRVGSSLLEMERTICETEPTPPSEAVAGTLRKRLRGDLDVIVTTALRKDPTRRYASAEQLATDVENHLKGLPLVARPDTVRYRTAKFLRRHRLAAGAAVAVGVSLIVGLALAVAGMIRAERAEVKAVAEAATSERIAEFLVDLFRRSDPRMAGGETVTARQLLDVGAERIDELAEQPLMQARLLRTMAEAYEGLGLFEPALALGERELEVQRVQFGERSVEAARVMTNLADLRGRRGDYAGGRDLAKQALDILEAKLPPDHPDVGGALNVLGIAHTYVGENAAARAALERSIAIREGAGDPYALELTAPLTNLAIVHWQEGDLVKAQALYERVLAIQERRFGDKEPVALTHTLNNLALVHEAAARPEEAEALHRRALAIRERILEPDHPDIAESLNNLGNALLLRREFAEARTVFERALPIREKALGADHVFTATTVFNIGAAIQGSGGGEAARPWLERAHSVFEARLGPEHVMLAYPLMALADLDARRGDLARAEAGLRRAVGLREKRLPEGHPEILEAREALAAFLAEHGQRSPGAPD
jgi:serine/threonine-protein kinase